MMESEEGLVASLSAIVEKSQRRRSSLLLSSIEVFYFHEDNLSNVLGSFKLMCAVALQDLGTDKKSLPFPFRELVWTSNQPDSELRPWKSDEELEAVLDSLRPTQQSSADTSTGTLNTAQYVAFLQGFLYNAFRPHVPRQEEDEIVATVESDFSFPLLGPGASLLELYVLYLNKFINSKHNQSNL
jgi:hypothetical protein